MNVMLHAQSVCGVMLRAVNISAGLWYAQPVCGAVEYVYLWYALSVCLLFCGMRSQY